MAVRLVSPGQQIAAPVRGQADINTAVLDTSAIGRGLEQGAATINQAIARRDAQRTQVDILDAEHQLAQAENEMLYAPETGALNRTGQNAFDVAKTTTEAYAKKAEELGKRFTTPEAKQVWKQRTLQRQDDIERNLLRHEAGERTKYADATTTNYVAESQNTAALNYNNPERVQGEIIRQQEAIMVRAQQTGLPAEQTKALIDTARSNTQMSVISRKMTADPFEAQAYYDKVRPQLTAEDAAKTEQALKPYVQAAQGRALAAEAMGGGGIVSAGPIGAQANIDQVLSIEGGYNNSPIDRGGPTKYGISSRAYPNLDIKNLTEAEARAIYKRDYWDKVGADNLPPELQSQAMDSAVNSGVGATKKMLAEAGGDPVKFAELRRQRYIADAEKNPEQKAHLAGWLARVDRSAGVTPGNEVTAKPGTEAFALEKAQRITNPDVRSEAMREIKMTFDIKKQAEADTAQAFSESVYTKIYAAPVGTDLTKIVSPEEMAWINASGNRRAFDNEVSERIKGQNPFELGEAGSISKMFYDAANGDKKAMEKVRLFNPYNVDLKIPLNMRKEFENDKNDLVGGLPTKRTATIKSIGDMTERMAYNSLGLPPADSRDKKQKAEFDKFNGALARSAAAWKASHDGKDPTEAEMQRLADYLVIDTAKGRLFEQKGNVSIDIIPPATLAQLKKDFEAEGIPFSPALAIRYYLQAGGGQ